MSSVRLNFEVLSAGDNEDDSTTVLLRPIPEPGTPAGEKDTELFCTREIASWFASRIYTRVAITIESMP